MSGGERKRGGTSQSSQLEASPIDPRRLSAGYQTLGLWRQHEACQLLLARLVGVGCGAEPPQRFICGAPPGAGGRRPVAQEGAAQMDRNGPPLSRICAGKEAGTGSPAKPRKEGVAETLGFCWDGELSDWPRTGRARNIAAPSSTKNQSKERGPQRCWRRPSSHPVGAQRCWRYRAIVLSRAAFLHSHSGTMPSVTGKPARFICSTI